ncbi:SymE family type I addiction module toxin [Paraburkholderia kirstenboschensis]|uniref:SymE family type I addiction module toxin n=1 Tax=Paraburkholderia kirstenboschensis TaxID=1245436 RepID=A0ABZ0EDC9_9BURK|nr:SymE family type I addiction module toxin [Paraburkholderia kirstenboschensis]WOD15236.1 SymE family type I addiction module toxin [Paraburkholderia kirstenboschensis]
MPMPIIKHVHPSPSGPSAFRNPGVIRNRHACPTVCARSRPLFPWMNLSGRWIETAGFEPGQRVRITVGHQKLVITPL